MQGFITSGYGYRGSGQPGQPITFEGERGAGGEWLTIIDGGTTTTSRWVPAPEVGSGVYKITSFPFEPGSMAVEEGGTVRDIPKIHKTSTAFTHLAKPADATEVTRYLGITVNFWDGIEALYYHAGTTLYVRFRNGDNPNSKTIRVGIDGWQGDLFTVRNKSFITIRNLQLQCSYRGIRLSQPDTHHVIIEGNRILATGRQKICMEFDVHDIDVRNNVGYMSGLGSYVPGAWGSGTTYDHGVKEHIYWVYKVYLSDSSSSTQEDSGITLSEVNGVNVRIHNNEIYNSLSGISIGDDCSKTEVYSNTIHNISSGGFYVGRKGLRPLSMTTLCMPAISMSGSAHVILSTIRRRKSITTITGPITLKGSAVIPSSISPRRTLCWPVMQSTISITIPFPGAGARTSRQGGLTIPAP